MTDTPNEGGQAFPTHPILYGSADQHLAQGMSLRDWFAGQALAGIAANCDASGINGWSGIYSDAAATAYAFADAMLEARK